MKSHFPKIKKATSISDFLERLKTKAKNYSEIEKIYLFGSFARGDATEISDIDLAFSLSNPQQWGVITGDFKENPRTLKKLDLVCLQEISLQFKNKILSEGHLIYERS